MKHLKSFYEKLTIEERNNRKLFKEEVWKKMSKEDQDRLINLRNYLSTARGELNWVKQHRGTGSDIIEKIKKVKKEIITIEKKYYDMYEDLFKVFINPTLSNFDSVTGVFEKD